MPTEIKLSTESSFWYDNVLIDLNLIRHEWDARYEQHLVVFH
jgi:hypothetical protein